MAQRVCKTHVPSIAALGSPALCSSKLLWDPENTNEGVGRGNFHSSGDHVLVKASEYSQSICWGGRGGGSGC